MNEVQTRPICITDLEYLVDLCQVYLAPVFQFVDADFLAIKQEKTKPHYLSSKKHISHARDISPTIFIPLNYYYFPEIL